ncbi:transcriptional regulator [Actinomyces naeslundii]|uniref:winged helix-turn-helix domain-containing protein n=1 Tax=Actinomyces naeslundii TaxID=1655 RepID=UPI00096DCAAA|nr:transcriptional regulator [Actinomyces naeslundii]OMG31547.1 transcriptional regulator [Actinomyces naeslundii]
MAEKSRRVNVEGSVGSGTWAAKPVEPAGAGVPVASAASAVDIDPVIHAQARLRIMATLAAVPVGDELHFPRLRELLDMTAGNLSTHLSKLEGAGYVQQNKTYAGRSPATFLALTPEGRVAFERYVRNLRSLLNA